MPRKYVVCLLLILGSAASAFGQAKPKVIDLTEKIHPIFQYSNWGGYFGLENGDLIIYEAVYGDAGKGPKPAFVGFVRKRLYTELVVKGRVLNSDTAYLSENFPSLMAASSLEEMDRLWEEKFNIFPHDAGSRAAEHHGVSIRIDYNNLDPVRQKTEVFVARGRELVKLAAIDAFYVWHAVVNGHLILACLSAGGSGHTIYLEIFNLDDARAP